MCACADIANAYSLYAASKNTLLDSEDANPPDNNPVYFTETGLTETFDGIKPQKLIQMAADFGVSGLYSLTAANARGTNIIFSPLADIGSKALSGGNGKSTVLKKSSLSLLSLSFTFFPSARTLFDQSENGIPPFVRVRNKNVYFYSSPSTATPLFALVPTYYLKVSGAEGIFWKVEVLEEGSYHTKLMGYVLASSVESIFTVPAAPFYPQEKVKVETSGTKIYTSPSITASVIVTAVMGQNMGYYGKIITTDREWYFVCFNGYLGYADAASLSTPAIANHPTPLSADDPVDIIDEPDPPDEKEEIPIDSLQLALILLITIPSVIIIIIILIPSKKFQSKKPVTYNYVEGQAFEDPNQPPSNDKKPKYYDDYI